MFLVSGRSRFRVYRYKALKHHELTGALNFFGFGNPKYEDDKW